MASFIVVDVPSSYNIILGQPALSTLQAVASPYHQKIKFPMENKVGEVCEDQQVSQKCYVETIRMEKEQSTSMVKMTKPRMERVYILYMRENTHGSLSSKLKKYLWFPPTWRELYPTELKSSIVAKGINNSCTT